MQCLVKVGLSLCVCVCVCERGCPCRVCTSMQECVNGCVHTSVARRVRVHTGECGTHMTVSPACAPTSVRACTEMSVLARRCVWASACVPCTCVCS